MRDRRVRVNRWKHPVEWKRWRWRWTGRRQMERMLVQSRSMDTFQ